MYDLNSRHIELTKSGQKIRLRRSLFWDLPEKGFNLNDNKRLIIERVLSRGNVNEFRQLNRIYSRDEIKQTVLRIGTFDKKTLNFLSRTYKLKPSEFKCYTKNQ